MPGIEFKMNLIAHVKVLVLPVGLCFSLIYFSGRSSGSARLGEGDCFHLSSADRRDLGITGKDQVVFIRPHSCQACTHDDMSVLAAISKSKKRFICLLDSDATSAEVSRWEKFGPVTRVRHEK